MTNPAFAELKGVFREASALKKFILINVAIFILLRLINLVYFLMKIDPASADLVRWLAVPSYLETLLVRPWTLITYMFLHLGFMHIFFNMIMLYFGGRIFTEHLGDKRLVSTYFLGGLTGAIFFILAFNVFPYFEGVNQQAIALGASASVLAILISAAVYSPNYTVHLFILGPVKIKFIAIFLVIMDLLSIEQGNPGGHIAHLGGALYGYTYVSALKRGNNIAGWFDKIADFFVTFFSPRSKLRAVHTNKKRRTDEEFNALKVSRQQRIDFILDKISKSGYDSLTKEEKEFLFNASKNL
jgi:membrane associated rhomboid family serine protease